MSIADPLAFYHGLNACGDRRNGLPHPVSARNGGIVAAWPDFAVRHGAPAAAVANPDYGFVQIAEFLRQTVLRDPLIQEGKIGAPKDPRQFADSLALVAAPLMFWSRRHALIELTDALERLLINTDVGDDLWATQLALPAPACFIAFGTAFQRTVVPGENLDQVVLGVYLFESIIGKRRALCLMPVHAEPGSDRVGYGLLELGFPESGAALAHWLRETCQSMPGYGAHFESLAALAVKVLLYLQIEGAVRTERREYSEALEKVRRLGPKKAARMRRQLDGLYDRIVLGPQTIVTHGHGEVAPHLRRGHFRMQPYGPQMSQRKLIFIAPMWVRADKLTNDCPPRQATGCRIN